MPSVFPIPDRRFEIPGPRGHMRVRFVSRATPPNLVVSRITEHATLGMAERYTSLLDGEVLRAPLEIFHDWSGMTGYDPDARKLLTDWNVRHSAHVQQVHMLVKSRVIAMGVSVSSLIAGRDFAAYSDRRLWERPLAALYPAHRRLFDAD